MFLKKCIQDLINAIETQNELQLRLASISFSTYLAKPTMRSDEDKYGKAITKEEIIYQLTNWQLCEWSLGIDELADDERSFTDYLLDQKTNEKLNEKIRTLITNFLLDNRDYLRPVVESEEQTPEPDPILNEPNLESPPNLFTTLLGCMFNVDEISANPVRSAIYALLLTTFIAGVILSAIGSCGISLGLLTATAVMAVGFGCLVATATGSAILGCCKESDNDANEGCTLGM